MKRIVSTITVLSMLLTMLLAATIQPTAATQTSTSSVPIAAHYDDKLVTWWNFEGDNNTTRLADKAKNGTAENLSPSSTGVTLGNNIATVDGTTTTSANLQISANNNTEDLANWNNKTLYIQYRVTNAFSGWADLFDVSGTDKGIRCFVKNAIDSNTGTATYTFGGSLGTYSGSSPTLLNGRTVKNPNNSSWCYLVVTFEEDTSGVTVTFYDSVGGSTFTPAVQKFSNSDTVTVPTLDVSGTAVRIVNTRTSGGKIEIADVRFYDAVLTEDVVSTLPSYTPYSYTFTPASYDENLVTWWDFEGGDNDSRLADKAKNGTAELLEISGAANVTLDGNTIETESPADLKSRGYVFVRNTNAIDVKSWENKTVYIKYKADGNSGSGYNSNLVNADGAARLFTKHEDGTYTPSGSISTYSTDTNRFTVEKTLTGTTGGWCYLVASYERVEEEIIVTLYYWADGSEFYKEAITKTCSTSLELASSLSIGDTNNANVSLTIDDVRFYDAILPSDVAKALPSYTPYSASTVVSGLHDANLVAYYDFEGDKLETQLADKAPVGLSKDTLKEGTPGGVSIEDGVATLTRVKNNNLQISKDSEDTKDLNGKTVYLKFNTSGNVSSGAYDIIGSTDTYRVFINGNANAHTFSGRNIFNPDALSDSSVPNDSKFVSAGSKQVSKLADQWYYMALTFELTETSYVVTTYYSINGTYYTNSVYTAAEGNIPADLIRSSAISIGNAGSSTSAEGATFSIDELRIYDTVLDSDAISNLAAEKPLSSCLNYLGTQSKINTDDTQDVRFLAHLNVTEAALKNYSEVGFIVSATYKETNKPALTVSGDTVYTSVIAAGETVTLADYGHINGYLIVLPIWDVPTDAEVVFTVQTYYKLVNSESDTPICGEAVEVVYNASSNA